VRRLVPFVLVIALAVGCGTVSVHREPGTATRIPARTLDPGAALLSEAQLQPIVGSLRRLSTTMATATPDPDPRGPCGAPIVQPSIRRGAFVEYERGGVRPLRVVQWVNDLAGGEAARTIAAVAADVQPGCPPYSTATPYGHPQRNGFVRTFPLGSVGDQRFAFEIWARVEVRGTPRAYATEILIRASDRLTAVALESLRPLPAALVRAVAARAAADLHGRRPAASA
jgi:hypothetical protein